MKNIYRIFIIAFLFIATSSSMNAAISYGLNNSCGTSQLIISVTPDINYTGGNAFWTPAVFTISWPMSLGTGVLGTITNQNGFAFGLAGVVGNDGTNYYQKYAHSAGTTLSMNAGTSYEVVRIALVGTVGTFGDFSIPASTNTWIQPPNNGISVFSNSLGNQVPGTYPANTLTNIPMFAGIFWDGVSWCGGSQANSEPGATDGSINCYINGAGAQITFFNGQINGLNIATGANLTIGSGFALKANGNTTINDPQSLIISADATGTGSFIDNGTITYNGSASATVQAYIQNTAGVGNFNIHQIGPLVYDPAFSLPGSPTSQGVYLQKFDLLQGSTYAYRYLEPTNVWQNISSLTEPIPTPHGIILSDISNVSTVLSQIGKLNTATINSVAATAGLPWSPSYTAGMGGGCLLLSNPYPSGLDLDVFNSVNPFALFQSPSFYIWQHSASAYATWNSTTQIGTGAMASTGGLISPGQGFFAVLSAMYSAFGSPALVFNNTMRFQYHAPFVKSEHANLLRLVANGNLSSDELVIYFFEGASSGIDTLDTYKWESMYEGATQINSVSTTGEKLTQNILPPLGNSAVSVPVEFYCGEESEYTITASDLESFENGTEIWLEDVKVGGPWYDLKSNPVYEFNANPEDLASRFIIHFFGSTGIGEPIAQNSIQIYGYGHDAYIVNRGTETVKEYVAYDMMGREIQRGTLPNNSVNIVSIGDVSAYYVVKVITKEGQIYNGKVFITK